MGNPSHRSIVRDSLTGEAGTEYRYKPCNVRANDPDAVRSSQRVAIVALEQAGVRIVTLPEMEVAKGAAGG